MYYERSGLLSPACRSENGYRWYGEPEVKRLKNIISYRSFGLPIQEIASLLDQQALEQQQNSQQNPLSSDDPNQQQILHDQFCSLEKEIQRLRQQQKAIVLMLEQPSLLEQNHINKQRWVEIMQAAGLNDQDMQNWHKQFEEMEPEAHQQFLESLEIDAAEIKSIRRWSKD